MSGSAELKAGTNTARVARYIQQCMSSIENWTFIGDDQPSPSDLVEVIQRQVDELPPGFRDFWQCVSRVFHLTAVTRAQGAPHLKYFWSASARLESAAELAGQSRRIRELLAELKEAGW